MSFYQLKKQSLAEYFKNIFIKNSLIYEKDNMNDWDVKQDRLNIQDQLAH